MRGMLLYKFINAVGENLSYCQKEHLKCQSDSLKCDDSYANYLGNGIDKFVLLLTFTFEVGIA